jgi:membrane protein
MRIMTLWHVTLRAAQDWWGDNCLRLAASLAYYTALSLAPLVLLIVGLVGMVLDRQQVATQLATQLEGLMGPAGRELVNSILTTTSPGGARWRPSSASSRSSSARRRFSASSRRR